MKKRALLISCFNWYKPRIETIRQILLDEYDVTVLIADFEHISKQRIEEKYSECIYIKVPEYKKNLSVARIKSHLVFGKAVETYIYRIHPELIFLQIPPNNVAQYCLKYKKQHSWIKYYIDLIDMWPESMPLGKFRNTIITSYWKWMRDESLQGADHVFTECKLYQKKLEHILNHTNTSTLYLFREQTDREREFIEKVNEEKRIAKKSCKKELSFAYLGSINYIIDMEQICDILREVIALRIKTSIHIIGDGEGKKRFLHLLKQTKVKIYYYGAIYDQMEKIKILAQCDFGFNMMKEKISVGLTTKSIDYFSMGLPIVNNIKGDTWRIVEKYGIGINWNDKSDLRVLIDQCNRFELYEKVRDLYKEKFTKTAFLKTLNNVMNLKSREHIL